MSKYNIDNGKTAIVDKIKHISKFSRLTRAVKTKIQPEDVRWDRLHRNFLEIHHNEHQCLMDVVGLNPTLLGFTAEHRTPPLVTTSIPTPSKALTKYTVCSQLKTQERSSVPKMINDLSLSENMSIAIFPYTTRKWALNFSTTSVIFWQFKLWWTYGVQHIMCACVTVCVYSTCYYLTSVIHKTVACSWSDAILDFWIGYLLVYLTLTPISLLILHWNGRWYTNN